MVEPIIDSGSAEVKTETPVTGDSAGQSASEVQAPEAGGQQSAGTPPEKPFDYDWWKKDTNRFGRIWKSEKDVIKSAYEADQLIEKQYKPLRQQAETFTKLLKDYGYEPDPIKLKSAFDELKSWKDPNNVVVNRGHYLGAFLEDPEFKVETENFLQGLRQKAIRREFGEGITDEVAKEILENRKYREEQTRKEAAAKQESQRSQYRSQIDTGWDMVQKECKALGFPVTDEIKVKLLQEASKLYLPGELLLYKFQAMYKEEIAKYQRAKMQQEQQQKLEKMRKTKVITGSSKFVTTPKAGDGQKPGLAERVMKRVGLKT